MRGVWRLPCLAAVVLAGCAGLLGTRADEALFADASFEAPARPVDPAALFEVSDAMRDVVAREIASAADPRRALVAALVAALGDRRLKIEYESTRTRTAVQAFDDRAGNCLSLVAMTAPSTSRSAPELLVAGDVDLAYWHAREAMRQAPTWLASCNTLAVVCLRRDLPGPAEAVLRTVLGRAGTVARPHGTVDAAGRDDASWPMRRSGHPRGRRAPLSAGAR